MSDLPTMSVDVVVAKTIPDLSGEVVVLAAGRRTDKYSRRSKKEQLYAENVAIIEAWAEQLTNSAVIVTTNPSTRITKYLVERGVEAYGAGVENDQVRFSRQAQGVASDRFLVGGHNFFDLVIGSNGAGSASGAIFTLTDYKQIIRRQDSTKKIISFTTGMFLEYDWDRLAEVNASVQPAYLWYARQRIHSKYADTAISCAIGVLDIAAMILQQQVKSKVVTVELPVNLPGVASDCVLGWPIDARSRKPVALAFDAPGFDKLKSVASGYAIANGVGGGEERFMLSTPFGAGIEVRWRAERIYELHSLYMSNLMSIARIRRSNGPRRGEIVVQSSRRFFDEALARAGPAEWRTTPQHRGKNVSEHTDLRVANLGDARAVIFPSGGAVGLVDDANRRIDFYCEERTASYHELRRIIRDEIAIPLMASAGCRLLHAAFVECEGVKTLILGPSGSGKTTLALSLLRGDKNAKYGSAERTLVWSDDGGLVALGVPESITVFPGYLRRTAEFGDLAAGGGEEDDWARDAKLRLQQSEIVARTGTTLMPGPSRVDLVVEVRYDREGELVRTTGAQAAPAPTEEVFGDNDLTRDDNVRIAWLNWFRREPDESARRAAGSATEAPNAVRVSWRREEALKEVVLNLIARKRIGRPSFAAP